MMDWLASVLAWKYPDAPAGSYLVRDDGAGPYIAFWNEDVLGPAPHESDLQAWYEQWQAEQQQDEQALRQALQVLEKPLPSLTKENVEALRQALAVLIRHVLEQ